MIEPSNLVEEAISRLNATWNSVNRAVGRKLKVVRPPLN